MDDLKVILGGIIGAIVLCVVGAGICYELNAAYNPAYTKLQYDTFKNSQQYNEGKAIEVNRDYQAYERADSDHRAGLAASVREEFANYDINNLPPQTRQELETMENDR